MQKPTEEQMRAGYDAARSVWDGVNVTYEAFRDRVLASWSAAKAKQAEVRTIHTDDLYLAVALTSSDQRALERHYVEQQAYFLNIALRVCYNQDDAEDVVSAFWADIGKHTKGYHGWSSLRGWHAKAIHSLAVDKVRAKAREPVHIEDLPHDPGENPGDLLVQIDDAVGTPRHHAADHECKNLITKLLDLVFESLHPEDYLMVYYIYLKGMSNRHYAGVVARVDETAVCKRRKKLEERMRRRMYEYAEKTPGIGRKRLDDCLANVPADLYRPL